MYVLAGVGEVLRGHGPQPGQVPRVLLLPRRDADPGDLSQCEHFGQNPSVAPICFGLIVRARSSFQDGRDHAVDAGLAQVPHQRTYPAGPDS